MQLIKKKIRIIPIIVILCVLLSSPAWAQDSLSTADMDIEMDSDIEEDEAMSDVQSEVNETQVEYYEVEDSGDTKEDGSSLITDESSKEDVVLEENPNVDGLVQNGEDLSVESENELTIQGQVDGNASFEQLYDSVTNTQTADFSGFKKEGNIWSYYTKGKLLTGSSTVVKGTINGTDSWWYIDQNGKADLKFNGFAENKNGWWYCKNGKVDFSITGFIKGAIDGENIWWYVKNNKVDFSITDVVHGTVDGKTAWWYVQGNKVVKGPTVAKNKNGWWYINSNGYVDFKYNGFAANKNGWWYCKNGKVDFSFTGFLKGTINGTNAWWYLKENKVDFSVTDIIYGTVDGKAAWWYVKENKVTKGPTVAKNKNGWYYINNSGYVDFKYTGFAKNKNGWWYCKNGKVNFSVTDIIYGTVDGKAAWWYIQKNKVTKGPTVAKNKNGWYYINNNGYVDFKYNGFAANKNGWWYCKNGKIDFSIDNRTISGTINGINASWYINNNKVVVPAIIESGDELVCVDENYNINNSYTGFAANKDGWWYCKNGEVDYSVTSVIKGTVDGKTAWWYVKNNKVTNGPTVAHNGSGWWYINKNGYVDFSYDGFASNYNGWWLVRDGKVSFDLTGAYWGTVDGIYGRWNVIENKVILASKGSVIKIPDGLGNTYTLTYYSDKGFVFVPSMRTSIAKGSNQERVWKAWKAAGAKYDNGLATINGAYLVAVTSTFGQVGDLLKITFRSGDTMLAVIADEKSQSYVAWDHNPANVYGHNNGKNVVEFEVDPTYYAKYNHPGSPTLWNSQLKNSGGVAQIENLGHKY